MGLGNRLHSKGLLIGSLAIVALLGSAVGAIGFDFDHPLARLLRIENGRFLHNPTAILCCTLVVLLSWWIVKLVRRLHRGRETRISRALR